MNDIRKGRIDRFNGTQGAVERAALHTSFGTCSCRRMKSVHSDAARRALLAYKHLKYPLLSPNKLLEADSRQFVEISDWGENIHPEGPFQNKVECYRRVKKLAIYAILENEVNERYEEEEKCKVHATNSFTPQKCRMHKS